VAAIGESQIYRDLMRFKPEALSPNAWAVKAGVSRTVWSDMRRHGNPSRRTLERLLAAIGSSLAEFEALRLGPGPQIGAGTGSQIGDLRTSWAGALPKPLPLVRSSLAGEWRDGSQAELTEIRPREVLERVPRPVSLGWDADAYAFTIVGDSMWPRFRPGTRVAVSPRSSVAIGDDVVVRLRSAPAPEHDGAERVLVMQLVKRTSDTFSLRQFNPDQIVEVQADEVEAVLKIVGELI
jgi:SOS-response transcriptional repressor LexA